MDISKLSGYYSDFNSSMRVSRASDAEETRKKAQELAGSAPQAQEQQKGISSAQNPGQSAEKQSLPKGGNRPLEDISLTFHKLDDFGYIGKDSDIASLDIRKAISDMQKDKILQQYNVFVGSSRNLSNQEADGIVIQKGNAEQTMN